MTYPRDIGAVDLMIGFPMGDKKAVYEYLMRGIKDSETKESFSFPAEYMFKDVPDRADESTNPVDEAFAEMDKWGVDIRHGSVRARSRKGQAASERYPGTRSSLSLEIDPNDITGTVRKHPRRVQGGVRPQGC